MTIIVPTNSFEYDGMPGSSTSITQTLASRPATSVTLDWTKSANTTAAMTTTGVKYARFYVVDANDTPVDATDNAHRLTITGASATLCINPASGYYVYPGSDGNINFSNLSVTLSASSTAALLGYKVKCWLATSETNIAHDGNTVTEEPDITNEYVYSFAKPAPTTVEKTGTIAWGASMQADATDGAPADWDTTWDELSREQRVVWYVTNGTTKQALTLGTTAQSGAWVLNLPTDKFSVSSNEAVLTGQTSFTDTEWDTWGKPALYAPTDAAYADVHGYNVVCEVYETAAGTVPNVRYTFSFTKDFLGELKSGVTATTQVETLANATDVSCTLSNITLPADTKYVRFYLTTSSDDPANPTGLLTFTGATPSTVRDHPEYGFYIYNVGGITAPTVTLTLTDATLNLYKVVMVTSADNAVTDGGAVVSEPNWDTQTTWSFKYPVSHTEATGTVEWSPVSMTVPLDIDTYKGNGYTNSLVSNYHVVWTVEVGGTAQTPATGSSRQPNTWTYSFDGDNATFYAPTGQTFADMNNVTFVARLYETATGENNSDLSLTYTVSIDRAEFLGQHKSTFNSGNYTIIIDAETTIPLTVPLSNATTAFSGAKYARVWLTQGGAAVNPAGKLDVPTGMTVFGTNHDATLGYYLYDEGGITLSNVTLTLASLSDYSSYQVHVALSADAPIGIANFPRADAPRRAPSLSAYEPDYDYEYTISFQDSSMKVIKIYVQASEGASNGNAFSTSTNIPGSTDTDTRSLLQRINAAFTDMGEELTTANCFAKWVILDENGDNVVLKQYYADPGQIQLGNVTQACYHANANENGGGLPTAVYVYNAVDATNELDGMLNAALTFGGGVFQLGKVIELWVTNVNNHTASDPADGYKVKVEIHFNEDGNPPYSFLNETAIAATKQMVDIGTLDATTPEFDMTEALVSGAKYARFYLTRYGSAAAASNTLTVTYDGAVATACAPPYGRYGFYISDDGGIDLEKLTVGTSLTPDGLMPYQFVVVSSSEALTGEQEPAWQKKHQISFQKVIHRRIMASATNTSVTNGDLAIGANSLQTDVLANLNAAIGDISGTLYARWYVLAPGGTTLQTVAGRNGHHQGNTTWGFNLDGNGNGQWQNIDNAYTLYTDMNGNVTSQKIAQNDNNGLWNSQIARATAIYVPRPGNEETHTLDYAGYRIVFEISDEYDPATNGTSPGFRLRYVYTLVDPADFVGNPKIGSAEGAVTQTVDRSAESVTLTLRQQPPAGPGATSNWALDHASLRGPNNHPRYARFYLTDLEGNAVDPTDKLTVTYGGTNATVTTCSTPEHGFYIAVTNNEGGPAERELQREQISVSLTAPGEYMLYKVVCIFSKDFEGAYPDDPLSVPLQREPDYDLKYTYSFDYNVTTAQFNRTIDWKNNTPMDVLADLPNGDPEQDWNISWEELSASQYVSWYVVNNQNQRQPIAIGNSRQAGTWTIDLRGLPFNVVGNTAAVATGQTVGENSWHRWGQPDIYAPTGMTYDQGQYYNLVCEVASTADATPYARYTFAFLNNILGELKTTGSTGEEIIRIEETATAVTVPLQHAVDKYREEHPTAKVVYVRAWLTTTDGALVSPTSLTWSQMYNGSNQVVPFSYHTAFPAWANYGYYWGSFDIGTHNTGIDPLNPATLTLAAGTHPQYQVHVALSTDNPNINGNNIIDWNNTNNRWEFTNATTGGGWWWWIPTAPVAHEPNYDYVYTFNFRYTFEASNLNSPDLITKYKTLIYDEEHNRCTPTILNNWPEVVAALRSSRDEFAEKGYVRWYLVDKATNEPIEMLDFTSVEPYVSLGNELGYYRRGFNPAYLQYQNNGANHQYDPTISLPVGYTYDQVRVICVATTLTDDIASYPDPLTSEPRQMQVKYVYDLMTEPELAAQPFIHYHGIHYPEYHRSFEDSREFIGPGQPQDLPAEDTAAAGIIERVWDYGKNAIYNPADNSYAANRTYYKSHDGPQVDPNDAASLLANSPDYTTRNIRQKTHTKEYNYYLLLADGEREALKLPYQDYLGGGNDTEPMAYIRWYDWKTDKNSDYLTPSGDADSRLIRLMSTERGADPVDRGWYNIMLNANPTKTNVGIDFVAPEGFSNMTEEIVIACDVSRYMDGLDDSKQYLVHEPTLSMRYIYHILPAKVLADKMVADAGQFNTVINKLEGLDPGATMTFADIENYEKTFHLMEYNGRTVVSVVGSGDPATPALGHFSLRTTLTELDHYYVKVGDELKPCNNLQWYAYYEYEGKLYRHKVPMVKTSWTDTDPIILSANEKKYGAEYHRERVRLAIFETADLCGNYERVRDPEEKLPFTIQPGQFIHLVGCLGYDDGGGNITEVPTVSTELFLVDAAPQALGTESFARTDYSMSSTYKKAAELNFDDFFDDPATRYDKPLNSFDNYAKIPMLFADAQYGFCYPRLYGQCATDWYLLNGHWEGFGFAPLHGDYTLLKSMNMPGVSQTRGETFDAARYQQAMYTTWYTTTPLYDVGHERASGKADSDTKNYGSFLYVDAAEQSRTIGRLEFDAQLCSGAEIYYTAYIADMTDAVRYGTDIPNTTPQVRFRVYTYNTYSGYPLGTVDGDQLLPGYTTQQTLPAISFVTGDIATEGAKDKGKWYQVYGYCNLPSEDRTFLDGDQRHFYVEVDNYCENTYGADYAVDQVTFYTSSARIRIAQISDVCDDEKGVKMRITALASALLPHFGKGQDREIFYRIYPYSHDENKTELEADEAITGQNVYCHEHLNDDGDRGNLYGAVPFHVGYNDQATYESNYDQTLYDSLEALLEAKKDLPEYMPKYGFYKDGDEVYYLLDERYFELTPGQEYFVSLYTLGSYKPGGLEGWGNPYGNHTCTAYSNNIMPRTMFIELTEDSEVSEGVVDMGCGHTTATKDFGVRVRYPLESGGYQTYTDLPFDFFLGTKTDIDEAYLKDEHGEPVMEDYTDENGQPAQRRIRLKDALAHFRGLMDGDDYKYDEAYKTQVSTDPVTYSFYVPEEYEDEDEHEGRYYQLLKEYVEDKKLLRLEATSTFTNTYTLEAGTTEVVDVAYLALPLYPQIDEDKEICSPITMVFHLDPTGGAPLMELGFDDVKYPESYKKRGVRLGLEQIAKMRDDGYMLHIPISNYHDKKMKEDPNALYFQNAVLKLSATNDPDYLNDDGNITLEATQLIVTTIVEPGEAGSSNEDDDGTGIFVSNKRMYLPLSFAQDSTDPNKHYVNFKEGYWYEVSTSYYDPVADAEDYEYGQNCFADLFIVFKVVPEFATWDSQPIGSTHLYNVSWHNDLNWKRSTRDQLYKDANGDGRTQNTNTAGHPAGYDNDGEGSLAALTGTLYEANPNPGFVPMKFTYVTLLTGNHAPSLINEARTTTGSAQTGGYLIDPNQTELMTDTSPLDNKESSKATDNIRYDMLVRYGPHNEGGEGCFGHRSKTKTDGRWGWRNDRRTEEQMTQFNTDRHAFDVEKFYGNVCKEIYFKPDAELLRQQRLTYQKAWVEKELVANRWYLAASPLKSTYAGDMYVPVTMSDVSMETPADKAGRQMTEAFQPIAFSTTATTVTDGAATSTPAYSRTKYPIYQRSWNTSDSRVYTKTNDARATDYSANLGYGNVSEQFVEWSHTYNDVQVPYSTTFTPGKVSVASGFSIRANRKQQKNGDEDVPALIRLPKADTQYDYYDWADQAEASGDNAFSKLTQTVSKPDVTLTNSINGTTWQYEEPSQHRFVTDDASKESSTQGAMEFSLDDLQVQGGYVLVGNPHVASLNMGEFFNGNPNLTHTGDDPLSDGTANYSYWTYEGSEAKAYLVNKSTETHVVSTVDGDVEQKTITYAITSEGNDEVGIIRPMQAFFVKKGTADKIYFNRGMTIDGNFPGEVGNGSRFLGLTLRAASSQGISSATVRMSDEATDEYREGEDVETLFDSNLSDVPMVYTVASGQAVSIDQRPQLDVVPFGVTCSSSEPVEVQVTSHLSKATGRRVSGNPLTPHLYFIDALTGEQTEVEEGSTVSVQPNDYGRYFISTKAIETNAEEKQSLIISVRQQEVTVTATSPLSLVRAITLDGKTAFADSGLGTQCHFQLAKGVYIIQAHTTGGIQRRLKVVVE